MLVADRSSTMDPTELFGEEDPVRDTATGRRLLEEGERRGGERGERTGERKVVDRQLRARLGRQYEPYTARAARSGSEQLDAAADPLVRRLSRRPLAERLDALLPPPDDGATAC